MLLQGDFNFYESETARQRRQDNLYDSNAPMLQSALQGMQKLQYLALLTNAISKAGEDDLKGQVVTRGCAEVRRFASLASRGCAAWHCLLLMSP